MPTPYKIPCDRPTLRRAFAHTPCSDAAHLPSPATRTACPHTKTLHLHDDGTYALLHLPAADPSGCILHAPDDISRAVRANLRKYRNPLGPSGEVVPLASVGGEKGEDVIRDLARTLRLPESKGAAGEEALREAEEKRETSAGSGREDAGAGGDMTKEPYELAEGEEFEILDKEEIDEEYWTEGGYWEGPSGQNVLQDRTPERVQRKTW